MIRAWVGGVWYSLFLGYGGKDLMCVYVRVCVRVGVVVWACVCVCVCVCVYVYMYMCV